MSCKENDTMIDFLHEKTEEEKEQLKKELKKYFEDNYLMGLLAWWFPEEYEQEKESRAEILKSQLVRIRKELKSYAN